MIRSVWCKNCKRIVNTIAKGHTDGCPKCGKKSYRSTAG